MKTEKKVRKLLAIREHEMKIHKELKLEGTCDVTERLLMDLRWVLEMPLERE